MKSKRKIIIGAVFMLMVSSIIGVIGYYLYENTYYVKTEDARLAADIVRVAPQISGKLIEFNAQEGQRVTKGQILGRQEMVNLPDSSMDLAVIKAPIAGLVIKEQGNVGEIVSPGQVLAMLVNPEEIYITANIEENKLSRVHQGQTVDITIDEYEGQTFEGKVASIGEATTNTFSLLPTSTGGTFTKVVQKIPVKITLEQVNGVKLLPGVNTVVKIHVK
ncbi:MAG TPA: HlyD family efflux transporter periplasmic adaptor subunit [Bacillota bacterium]|nr:HlyD family efflux transporter periplasmic adaptor subunit [Bacillota bacterium]